jgi:hypothetical protein
MGEKKLRKATGRKFLLFLELSELQLSRHTGT